MKREDQLKKVKNKNLSSPFVRSFIFQRVNGEFITNSSIIRLSNRTFETRVINIPRVENLGLRIFLSAYSLVRCAPRLLASQTLITQFPPKFEEIPTILLCHALRRKNIMIVHDLDHLRNIQNRGLKFFGDPFGFKMLKNSQVIIQNGPMQKILEQNGIVIHGSFEIWPYLIEYDPTLIRPNLESPVIEPVIVFAGNYERQKSQFLTKLDSLDFPIHIFGKVEDSFSDISNAITHGDFRADNPPNFPWPSLGLIWDGDSVNNLSGIYGDYHKLNLPAKFSLYITCGLPVVVSNQSALSQLVLRYRLGFVVASLNEIPRRIGGEEWGILCQNVKSFSQRSREGEDIVWALKHFLLAHEKN